MFNKLNNLTTMKRHNFLFMTAAIAVLMLGVAMFTGCNKDDDNELKSLGGTSWKATFSSDYEIISFSDNTGGTLITKEGSNTSRNSFIYDYYKNGHGTITLGLDRFDFSISGETLKVVGGATYYKE